MVVAIRGLYIFLCLRVYDGFSCTGDRCKVRPVNVVRARIEYDRVVFRYVALCPGARWDLWLCGLRGSQMAFSTSRSLIGAVQAHDAGDAS